MALKVLAMSAFLVNEVSARTATSLETFRILRNPPGVIEWRRYSLECNLQLHHQVTTLVYPALFCSVPQFLESFVRRGPNGYEAYCAERLRRIKANGERKEVPCWIEIEVETFDIMMAFSLCNFSQQYFLGHIYCKEKNTCYQSAMKFQILCCFLNLKKFHSHFPSPC